MARNTFFLILPLFTLFSFNTNAQLPGCAVTINTFPYTEDFEVSTGAWSNVTGDDFDWTRDSGGTPSNTTGPTTGSGSVWYMYIETSGSVGNGDRAILESNCFDFTGLSNPKLEFDYHMYGSSMGTLDVEVSTDGITWTNIWTLSGDQTNTWFTAGISLSAFANQTIGLRFIGTDGASWRGDAAIDNIFIFDEVPMQFESSTVTQSTTLPIENCAPIQDILRIEVVTSGQLFPIDATEFIIRTDGSSLPLTDIENIQIYYTGASNAFSTANLFGSSAPLNNGVDIPINGTQTLLEGVNYFWISYDVAIASTIGNFVDGICNQITVDGANEVPTISNPAGNREIIDCQRACPTQAQVFLEDFETGPLIGVQNSQFLSGSGSGRSNFNPSFALSGSFFGWFNVADSEGPFDVFDRRIEGLYVDCEATVSYSIRGQNNGAGPMARVDVSIFDDNGVLLASNLDYILTTTHTQFTYTFTCPTPGIRFNVYFDDVGAAGRDIVLDDISVVQCCDMPVLLPVELTTFTSDCVDDEVQLKWTTESETNNDYFTIERSRDAYNFEKVALIGGQGNSSNKTEYTWVDKNPLNGMAYYRLSQTDFDGASEIFEISSVDCQGEELVTVFPNPFENELSIQSKTRGTYTLSDVSGKIVLFDQFNAGETNVNTSHLSAGTYLVKIEVNTKSTTHKLIKL